MEYMAATVYTPVCFEMVIACGAAVKHGSAKGIVPARHIFGVGCFGLQRAGKPILHRGEASEVNIISFFTAYVLLLLLPRQYCLRPTRFRHFLGALNSNYSSGYVFSECS